MTGFTSQIETLWQYAEKHLAAHPDYQDILEKLQALDAADIDCELTQATLTAFQTKLTSLSRMYLIDHNKITVEDGYWEATDKSGKTNLQRRKAFHNIPKSKLKKVQGKRLWKLNFDGVVYEFTTRAQAELAFDQMTEEKRTSQRLAKSYSNSHNSEDDAKRKLAAFNLAASERKASIRNAMQPNPKTGVIPSWSKVIQRPEFSRSNEPYMTKTR